MPMITIPESGMRFGPFNKDRVFRIETSTLYATAGEGIRSVEFLLVREPKSLIFLEAKSSSPNPDSEPAERFSCFIREIAEKFIHSFELYYSAILKRHEQNNDIPDFFKHLDNGTISIVFCLVIKGHKIDWLPCIHAALRREIAPYIAIWGITVAVFNDQLAKEYHLIDVTA